ncbi:MAG: hypothetical protein KUG75_15280 [Pseudomonadales bacterium]|nr:hypothetical protein [Pseudomonadales bacterium]
MDEHSRTKVLSTFCNGEHIFRSTPEFNDMWHEVDLNEVVQEVQFVADVKRELAKRYRPFARAQIIEHC